MKTNTISRLDYNCMTNLQLVDIFVQKVKQTHACLKTPKSEYLSFLISALKLIPKNQWWIHGGGSVGWNRSLFWWPMHLNGTYCWNPSPFILGWVHFLFKLTWSTPENISIIYMYLSLRETYHLMHSLKLSQLC